MLYFKINNGDDLKRVFPQDRQDYFSYYGYEMLVDILSDIDDLDPIAICCDFCEYDSKEEMLDDYKDMTWDDFKDKKNFYELKNGHYLLYQGG